MQIGEAACEYHTKKYKCQKPDPPKRALSTFTVTFLNSAVPEQLSSFPAG